MGLVKLVLSTGRLPITRLLRICFEIARKWVVGSSLAVFGWLGQNLFVITGRPFWCTLVAVAECCLLLNGRELLAQSMSWEAVPLPALKIEEVPARAHTQGLEIQAGTLFVTARREDVTPRRALLLRLREGAGHWESWDITRVPTGESKTPLLDHPGGFQSDGTRLWIPVSQSRRNGKSVICSYRLADLKDGEQPRTELEFPVDDHVGAIAVGTNPGRLWGASWDTESVYEWDFSGKLLRKLRGAVLASRGIGTADGEEKRNGLAVQDWKYQRGWLWASGLMKSLKNPNQDPQPALVCFRNFFQPDFQRREMILPKVSAVPLTREGMAISEKFLHFLPEDLGQTNRMFKLRNATFQNRLDGLE